VSSKITGKLASLSIEEGDHVQEGQVLARLDDTDQQAQLALAQAQVAAARSQLGSLQAQLAQARRDLKRQQALSSRGLAAEQALEDAKTKVESLSAQLDAQRSQVSVAEAQLNIAKVNEDDTVIRAPFTGVVVDKAAQPGEIVSPISGGGGFTRTGICTIVDMGSLEIEVDVNEAYINRVQPQQPATAVLDAYPDWKIPAKVIAIIPTADRSKATVKVRIAIEAHDTRIVPDMGVRVSFLEDKANADGRPAGAVLVPASALVERNGNRVAFVVEGERARLRIVTVGDSYGDLRVVDKGLSAGARVVRDPPPRLADGTRVKAKAVSAGSGDD
jgi:RND family efflux transporter MFP subunit